MLISKYFQLVSLSERTGVNDLLLCPIMKNPCHHTVQGSDVSEHMTPRELCSKHFKCVHAFDSHPQQTYEVGMSSSHFRSKGMRLIKIN